MIRALCGPRLARLPSVGGRSGPLPSSGRCDGRRCEQGRSHLPRISATSPAVGLRGRLVIPHPVSRGPPPRVRPQGAGAQPARRPHARFCPSGGRRRDGREAPSRCRVTPRDDWRRGASSHVFGGHPCVHVGATSAPALCPRFDGVTGLPFRFAGARVGFWAAAPHRTRGSRAPPPAPPAPRAQPAAPFAQSPSFGRRPVRLVFRCRLCFRCGIQQITVIHPSLSFLLFPQRIPSTSLQVSPIPQLLTRASATPAFVGAPRWPVKPSVPTFPEGPFHCLRNALRGGGFGSGLGAALGRSVPTSLSICPSALSFPPGVCWPQTARTPDAPVRPRAAALSRPGVSLANGGEAGRPVTPRPAARASACSVPPRQEARGVALPPGVLLTPQRPSPRSLSQSALCRHRRLYQW